MRTVETCMSREDIISQGPIKQKLQTTAFRTTQMTGKGAEFKQLGQKFMGKRVTKSFVYSDREEESQEGRDTPWNCRQPCGHRGCLALLKHLCLLSGTHVISWAPTSPGQCLGVSPGRERGLGSLRGRAELSP